MHLGEVTEERDGEGRPRTTRFAHSFQRWAGSSRHGHYIRSPNPAPSLIPQTQNLPNPENLRSKIARTDENGEEAENDTIIQPGQL